MIDLTNNREQFDGKLTRCCRFIYL